jgi:ABC-type polysaccharide/polyol phosphate transport system ATPase subunit
MHKERANLSTIFELKNVSVSFDKHAIKQRSLKYVLNNMLDGRRPPKIHALTDINLSIPEGAHVGIIGRNGAGKSTLLKVMTRVIIPQHGAVLVNKDKHVVPLLELGIGFQPDLTGRENCYLTGILMGYDKAEIDTKIDSIIRFSDLDDFIDEPVKNYSSGMYARLAFAIATDVRPDVLLVDEVFGVGDEFFMRKCIVRMQRLMQAGSTLIYVSHNLDFLVTQCSRLIWLDEGRVVMDGDPPEISGAYRSSQGIARCAT